MFLVAAQTYSEHGVPDDAGWGALAAGLSKRSRFEGMTITASGWKLLIVPTREHDRILMHRWRIPDILANSHFTLSLGPEPLLEIGVGPLSVGKAKCEFSNAVLASDGEQTVLYRGVTSSDRLCYAHAPSGLLVASCEQPLMAALGPTFAGFDDDYLGCYLAALPAPPDATIHRAVRQVCSGRRVLIRRTHERVLSSVLPTPVAGAMRISDAEAGATLGALIDKSVAVAIGNGTRLGLSLSGGLDSSTLAAAWARLKSPESPDAVVCSYGFPSFPDVDETARSRALADHLGLRYNTFNAEPHLPLAGAAFEGCPDRPDSSPYRAIRWAQLAWLQSEGVDLCLDGSFGDDAFDFNGSRVFIDLLKSRRLDLLASYVPKGARNATRFMARQTKGVLRLAAGAPAPTRIHWLSKIRRERVLDIWNTQLHDWRHFPSAPMALACFGPLAALAGANDAHHNARSGVDFSFPFFNADILSFVLSLPSHQSYRHGQWKWLLRESQRGLLPDWCRMHPKSADLTPVFQAAVQANDARWKEHERGTRSLFPGFLAEDAPGRIVDQMSPGDLLSLWQRAQLHRWLVSTQGARTSRAPTV